jgi:hypothetical protein
MPTKKSLYWIKKSSINGKCPVCGAEIVICHIGEYCSKCSYCDGMALLTPTQAKRFNKKL